MNGQISDFRISVICVEHTESELLIPGIQQFVNMYGLVFEHICRIIRVSLNVSRHYL